MNNIDLCMREITNNKREIVSNIMAIIFRVTISTFIGFLYGFFFWRAFAAAFTFFCLGGVISINKFQECMRLTEENKGLEYEIKKIKRIMKQNENIVNMSDKKVENVNMQTKQVPSFNYNRNASTNSLLEFERRFGKIDSQDDSFNQNSSRRR